jgi:ribonuclease P protein subunit RPR2
MGGAELCARLKAEEQTKLIPIVLLTGADPEEARRAKRAGAAALVHKPFSPLELLAVVERTVGLTPVRRKTSRSRQPQEEVLLYARDLRQMLEIERGQRALLAASYIETVTALASALETKDTGTHAHSHRVRRYAVELLETIDSGRLAAQPGIEYGFLLHDIGKIGIPDGILQKPGPLTSAEQRRMQTHTLLGEQMLAGVAVLRGEGLRVVRSHHERWDGRGYPDGLERRKIPIGARVFALADALDAMTSHRPYRRAMPWSAARDEIFAQAGKQFDPQVVEAFRTQEPNLREVRRTIASPSARSPVRVHADAEAAPIDVRKLSSAQRGPL